MKVYCLYKTLFFLLEIVIENLIGLVLFYVPYLQYIAFGVSTTIGIEIIEQQCKRWIAVFYIVA